MPITVSRHRVAVMPRHRDTSHGITMPRYHAWYHGAICALTPTFLIVHTTGTCFTEIPVVSKGCRLRNPSFGMRGPIMPLRPRLTEKCRTEQLPGRRRRRKKNGWNTEAKRNALGVPRRRDKSILLFGFIGEKPENLKANLRQQIKYRFWEGRCQGPVENSPAPAPRPPGPPRFASAASLARPLKRLPAWTLCLRWRPPLAACRASAV